MAMAEPTVQKSSTTYHRPNGPAVARFIDDEFRGSGIFTGSLDLHSLDIRERRTRVTWLRGRKVESYPAVIGELFIESKKEGAVADKNWKLYFRGLQHEQKIKQIAERLLARFNVPIEIECINMQEYIDDPRHGR